MLLSFAVTGFIADRVVDGYSPNTLAMYKWALDLLLTQAGDIEITSIQDANIKAFFYWLRTGYVPTRMNHSTEPLTERSIENIWTALRSFFNWLSQQGLAVERPDHSVRRPRYAKAEIKPFSQSEVLALLKACDRTRPSVSARRQSFTMRRTTAVRDRLLILFLLDTGLRVSEAARVRIEDIRLDEAKVYVIPYGTGRKTKSRTAPIGKGTIRAMWRYLAQRETFPDEPLFLTSESRPMNRSSIRLVLKEIGDRAGVPDVHPHRFRHTFAIQYLRNGGDVFSLQNILGHQSLEMVKHYLDLVDKDAALAHRMASPVDRWRL